MYHKFHKNEKCPHTFEQQRIPRYIKNETFVRKTFHTKLISLRLLNERYIVKNKSLLRMDRDSFGEEACSNGWRVSQPAERHV